MSRAKVIISKNFITVMAPYDGNRHYETWLVTKEGEVEINRYEDGQLISLSIELPDAFKNPIIEIEDY